MSKGKEYYHKRIGRILTNEILRIGIGVNYTYDVYVTGLLLGYSLFGIDWLLGTIENDDVYGLSYISMRAWDRIIDYDYLAQRGL